jgi:hypothetical protein
MAIRTRRDEIFFLIPTGVAAKLLMVQQLGTAEKFAVVLRAGIAKPATWPVTVHRDFRCPDGSCQEIG